MSAPGHDDGEQPSWIELDDALDKLGRHVVLLRLAADGIHSDEGSALAELQDIMVDQLSRVTDLLARLKPGL